MRQLTALDAQFLAMESARITGHVSGLAIYDPSTAPGGTLTQQDICRLVSERLHLLPPFKWRLVPVPFDLDHPYWIDDPDFDLDFHIRETAVAPPGDDRHLADLVARIVGRPLDRGRPLWELYLIHGLPDGRVGILTKVHHAVVDGVSGAEILTTLLDLSPEGREVPPPPKRGRRGERAPTQLEMLGLGLLGLPRQPVRALRALPTTVGNLEAIPGAAQVPGVLELARTGRRVRRMLPGAGPRRVIENARAPVPRTRFNTRVSQHRRFAFSSLSLDRVKAVKNELGITVNDVVVGLCATGLRRWLQERGELPQQPLVAMVPVSVRTQEQVGTFGNRVSAMFSPIPTDVDDPRERLMKAHEILSGAKDRHRAVPAELLQDATRFIPPAVHARASRLTMELAARFAPPINLVISNVPGPRVPLYMAGARLEAHYPVSVITDGVGLNITCMSYLDRIDFGIVADHDQIDEAWSLMESMDAALLELEHAVGAKKPARKRDLSTAPAS
jgi:WS/DGAT/MGAT family acyltransferase